MAMKVKLQYLHDDPEKNYRIRCCVPVRLAAVAVPGSIQVPCDECGDQVWLDPNMPLPNPDNEMIDGDVNLCISCTALHSMLSNQPVKWIAEPPPNLT